MKRFALVAAAAIGVFAFAVCFAGWALTQTRQVSIGAAPPDLKAESVEFSSAGNTTIRGWWCPLIPSRGSILLLPGIRANRLSMVERARFLQHAGFSVLLIDLRATGDTRGQHITFGWEERQDVLAAVDFLRAHNPNSKIGVIGSSLGGAAALLASPPLKIDALVIEAVYPSIKRATNNRLRKYTGPLAPWLAPLLLGQLKPRLGISIDELRPIDHLLEIHCPIFFVGGAIDQNTTVEDTRRLFAAANAPKNLWLVSNAGHVDLHHFAQAEYEERVLDFFSNSFED